MTPRLSIIDLHEAAHVQHQMATLCDDAPQPLSASRMHLSDHDLRQLDEAYLDGLVPEQAHALLGRSLADLKAARERLNQNPSNSSRPPSSRPPWEARETGEAPASDPETPDAAAAPDRYATAGETPKVSAKAPPASDAEILLRVPLPPRPRRRRLRPTKLPYLMPVAA